jgi:DNA polymerase III delta subunit
VIAPILIFWGDDDLGVFGDLVLWRDRFRQKQDEASIVEVDGEAPGSDVQAVLQDAAGSQSLFSTAKLVIVKHFLNIKDEKAQVRLTALLAEARAGEMVVFLWQRGNPDRRRSLVKQLLEMVKKGQATLFERVSPSKPADRLQWLQRYWQAAGCAFESAAADDVELATRQLPFGCLRQLADICLLAGSPRLDRSLVSRYLPAHERPEDFAIINALQAGDRRAALSQLATISLRRDENIEQGVLNFGSVVYFIEKGWQLRSLADSGLPPNALAGAAGLSPFVAQRMLSAIRQHESDVWRVWYRQAADLEWQAKHGEIDLISAAEKLIWMITK